jgi:hypothetical protein
MKLLPFWLTAWTIIPSLPFSLPSIFKLGYLSVLATILALSNFADHLITHSKVFIFISSGQI